MKWPDWLMVLFVLAAFALAVMSGTMVAAQLIGAWR